MAAQDESMRAKVCMITGATSGIGLETARVLAQKGATVIVVGRNPEKGASVVEEIQAETGNQAVTLLLADLSEQAQVRRLAQEFQERYQRLDVLINNAGGYSMKRKVTADGLEMVFALNYLAPFLLTHLLLDTLEASSPSRVINVSSDVHRSALMDFEDLQAERKYSSIRAYGQSKLALTSFTYEQARRLEGSGVTVNAVHPGFIATGIFEKSGGIAKLAAPLLRFMSDSPQEGAYGCVYLASSPEVAGMTGKYLNKTEFGTSSPATYDEALAQRLWEISMELTGLAQTPSP